MSEDIAQRVLEGDRRALTRILTWVENGYPEAREALRSLFPHSGRAHIVGVTGPTGSGKSTLLGALAREYRNQGRSIGIVVIDPTSPFSHGAILGDRIRMQDLTSDPEVFIRSMATRGALGGLAAATNDVVTVLDACGKDVVLVETVGAGQDEVEIADTAHTTVVINILEIADILVVNKADLPAAEAVFKQLHIFMDLARYEGWEVPIIKTVSHKGEGVTKLLEAIDNHRAYLQSSGRLEKMRRQRARRQLLAAAQAELLSGLLSAAESNGRLDTLVDAIVERELDPHTAAEQLIANP